MPTSDDRTAVVRAAEAADDPAILALWQAGGLVRPWNDPVLDLARKRADSPWGLLVAAVDGAVVGTVMVGYDGHRGAVNYLAVAPEQRGRGIGSALMDAAETLLRARGCPKVALSVRAEHAEVSAFYARRGYVPESGIGHWGLRLIVDGPPSS
jgi:ribosomal protein S18 acetylase RimI-like enzyme